MAHKDQSHGPPRQFRGLGTALPLFLGLTICVLVYLYDARSSVLASKLHVRITQVERYLLRQPAVAAEFKRCRRPWKSDGPLANLVMAKQWHSCKPRQRESITLVTQLTLERLEMLENQCRVWHDPIAAAVYVPIVRGRIHSAEDASLDGKQIPEAVLRLGAFHDRMQQQGACVLDLELTTEDFDDEEDTGLYPVNAMRNRALMLARTEALLLLDADFVPSNTQEHKSPEGYDALMQRLNRPEAIVLPAFETASNGTDGKELALNAAEKGKSFAVDKYVAGSLAGFAMREYARGHAATNYERWKTAGEIYEIDYPEGYEPYVIVSRHFTPWYDERFKGYRKNKIQHLAYLAGLNVTFSVHPSSFTVHVPHKKSPTYWFTKNGDAWYNVAELYGKVHRQIKRHEFVPVVSFSELCAQQ